LVSKSLAEIETRSSLGDSVEQQGGHDSADDLGDDVRNDVSGGKTSARGQSHGDRWVEMASRNVADRIGHGHHGEAESERNAEKADADLRKAGGDDRTSTAPERQPKGTDRLGNIGSVIHCGVSLSLRQPDPNAEPDERLKVKGWLVLSERELAAIGMVINRMIADHDGRNVYKSERSPD